MTVPAEIIAPAIAEVLETMYFCEPVYRGAVTIQSPVIGTAVRFSGALQGELTLVVSEELAQQLAADFLADEARALSREQVEATVRELANIACGATLGAWMPDCDVHFAVPDRLERAQIGAEFAHGFSVNGDSPEIAVELAISGSLTSNV